MTDASGLRKSILLRVTGAAVMPFAVLSGYLLLSRRPGLQIAWWADYSAIAIAALTGSCFVAALSLTRSVRVLLLAIYFPVVSYLLFFFAFELIAVVFHDGL